MRKLLLCLPWLLLGLIPTIGGSAPRGVELLVLGSGGPGAEGRASSSYLVLIDGAARILIDAGPGAFARLGEAHVGLDALDVVLLTHLHIDHAAELPGIVKARAVASARPIQFDIFGPGGGAPHAGAAFFPSTRRFVELLFGPSGAFAYLKDFAAPVSFTVTDLPHRPRSVNPEVIYARDGVLIRAVAGHHDDAPAIVYRVEVDGRSIVFSGDIDAHGLPALEQIARDASLLVFDAVVLDPPGSPAVLYSLHSAPEAIGQIAGRDHVGRLLLSHLSPAVDQHRDAVTASIAAHYPGPVEFASDKLRLTP